jgi:cytochrome c biogenesis protein CcdA
MPNLSLSYDPVAGAILATDCALSEAGDIGYWKLQQGPDGYTWSKRVALAGQNLQLLLPKVAAFLSYVSANWGPIMKTMGDSVEKTFGFLANIAELLPGLATLFAVLGTILLVVNSLLSVVFGFVFTVGGALLLVIGDVLKGIGAIAKALWDLATKPMGQKWAAAGKDMSDWWSTSTTGWQNLLKMSGDMDKFTNSTFEAFGALYKLTGALAAGAAAGGVLRSAGATAAAAGKSAADGFGTPGTAGGPTTAPASATPGTPSNPAAYFPGQQQQTTYLIANLDLGDGIQKAFTIKLDDANKKQMVRSSTRGSGLRYDGVA